MASSRDIVVISAAAACSVRGMAAAAGMAATAASSVSAEMPEARSDSRLSVRYATA